MKKILSIISIVLMMNVTLLAQSEGTICYRLFHSSNEFTELGKNAIATAAEAVWGASELNGNIVTLTGTLTQSAPGSDVWTYSSSPTDKLVVAYSGGPTIEIKFTTFEGYIDDTWEKFVDSHKLNFTIKIVNYVDLNIQSLTVPDQYLNKVTWQRHFSGTVVYENDNTTISISHNGSKAWEISSGYASYIYDEQCTGNSNSITATYSINETYWSHLIHNSNTSQFVINKEITNNSSVNFGGSTYKFQNGYVKWEAGTQFADSARAGIYNQVLEPTYWVASGSMIKNETHFGNIIFDRQVVFGTNGPLLVLQTVSSQTYLLHPLLQWWMTDVDLVSSQIPIQFDLKQNYPNPFNPSTVIRFQIPKGEYVILKIYDPIGREVETLVDEFVHPGFYDVTWDSKNHASGIYFYKLISKGFSATNKMILLR